MSGRLVLAATLSASVLGSPVYAGTPAIPLQYDATLAADGFPSPLIWLTVGDARAVFLVDTGAGVHTLARWFVAASGLRAKATDRTTFGSTGHETPVEVVSPLAGRLDNGRRLLIPQAIVTDFPPVFEQHRIGGLVSPQLLAASGEDAIVDLLKPRLTFRRARTPLGSASSGDDRARGVCTNADSPFRNRLYAATVLLDGAPATLLIDTGATGTLLSALSTAAHDLSSRSVSGGEIQGVGGSAEPISHVPSVAVKLGGTTTVVDLGLGPVKNGCGPDGVLGMDALTRCVVVLGESHFEMTCRPR